MRIDYQRGWWNRLQSAGGKSIPQRGTNGCKGSQSSHRGSDMGNKEAQPIRGSKRREGSGRDGTKNEIRKIYLPYINNIFSQYVIYFTLSSVTMQNKYKKKFAKKR